MAKSNAGLEAYIEASRKLPLDQLLEKFGAHGFKDGKSPKLPCPFCGDEGTGKFGIKFYASNSRWTFKCFNNDCAACKPPRHDAVGFIMLKEGTDEKAAFKRYLELAGVQLPERKPEERQSAESPADGEPTATVHEPEPADLSAPGEPKETEPKQERGKVIPFTQPPRISGETIWAEFHSRLTLSAADREKLKTQRGFSDRTIDALGFRSNLPGNREILFDMSRKFSFSKMLRTGLFMRERRTQKPVPNPQFCGYGITNKKDEKGERLWDWTHPVLIPYLDEHGHVFFMRPHKGNIRRDDEDDETAGGHVYCPFLLKDLVDKSNGLAVLTESEFKAGAGWQCEIPIIGIPGTSFVKNYFFRLELVRLLDQFRVSDLVIVFDNEIKDNPDLPGYKPDPRKRYDTQIWARYIAWDLMKKSPKPIYLESVRIGQLPDAWRLDEKGSDTGKTDWDSALAQFVRQQNGSTLHGTAAAKTGFEQVIESAVTPNDSGDLFPTEAQRIISVGVRHKFHKALLPGGDSKMEALAARIDRINGESPREYGYWARDLSAALRMCVGTYYQRTRPEKTVFARLARDRQAVAEKLEQLGESTEPGVEKELSRARNEKKLLDQLMEGVPEPISNFTIRCEYTLHTAEGKTDRLIRVIPAPSTGRKPTRLIRIPAQALARLAEMREFCLGSTEGAAVWRGGEKDLQMLCDDMAHYTALGDVHEIPYYGYHPRAKLWFFGDCAVSPDGRLLRADENNVFWHEGLGYQVDASADKAGEGFQQGSPKLLAAHGVKETETDVKTLFSELAEDFYNSVGDYGGALALGNMLAYAVSPEMYAEHGGHPGLWLSGKRAQGKTTLARIAMRIWGFRDLSGINILKSTTHVGMQRCLAQVSFLPVWFDEYRRSADEEKQDVLRAAYDRGSSAKGQIIGRANSTRDAQMLTTPVVTGESQSSDAATRSRYIHLVISATDRKGDDKRMKKNAPHLYKIGQWLMQNREKYLREVRSHLEDFSMESVVKSVPDDRTRFVYGLSYACYLAMVSLMELHGGKDPFLASSFQTHAVKAAEIALRDVIEETMVNRFWNDIISGLQRSAVSPVFFEIAEVYVDTDGHLLPDGMGLKGDETVRVCYILAKAAYDEYAADIRKRNETPPLSKEDIQREISKEKYYVKPAKTGPGVNRIQVQGRRGVAWVINLKEAPFGDELAEAVAANKPATK